MAEVNSATYRYFFPATSETSHRDAASETFKKIDVFGSLPVGWHYGTGGPISERLRSRAKRLVTMMQKSGFFETDAFPGSDNEIQVTGYHGDHFIELTCDENGLRLASYERDDAEVWARETGTPEDIIKTVSAEILDQPWVSFASYTPDISVAAKIASQPWPFVTLQTAAEVRSLTQTALMVRAS